MKPKKTKKADLNNYTSTFFLLGLIAMLFISWKVIEIKTPDAVYKDDGISLAGADIDETLDITIEQPKPKEIIPPKVVLQNIDVVDDNNDDVPPVDFLSSDDDDDDPILPVDKIQIDDDGIDKPDPDVPFKFIQRAPTYPGCEGKKGEALKKCVADKIIHFVADKFDKEIAEDLGLSGKIKIMTQFTINKQGNIVGIKARAKNKELANEAKRVIGKLPKMKPGKQRDRAVNVTYTLPIIFKIEEE